MKQKSKKTKHSNTHYLGIDVGSVSTKAAVIDDCNNIIAYSYTKTEGNPINALQKVFRELMESHKKFNIKAAGTTGSGRDLAKSLIGADIAKNEITAHASAALTLYPETKTILEIGGQDSKIIIMNNETVVDFAMNSVCAAGTGSFLDQQANRLGIAIEDFGDFALRSKQEVNISGRCTVFAESDMIHKQQLGFKKEDLINGLCSALVRNYLNNICKGKTINEPILFQGGVAANVGLKKAFEKQIGKKVIVPEHYAIMGAIGAAIIAKKSIGNKKTKFFGFKIAKKEFTNRNFTCNGCSNNCEVTQIYCDRKKVATMGDKCGKYSG